MQQRNLLCEDIDDETVKSEDGGLTLEETIDLDHLKTKEFTDCLNNKFTLSQSGSIGTARALAEPSLSVTYPGGNHAPRVLSAGNNKYWSAVHLQGFSKEYLASACHNDEAIHLWNLDENSPPHMVYKLNSNK